MFPIAFTMGNIGDRSLLPDDIAAAVDIYGTTAATEATGSISGTITKNGARRFRRGTWWPSIRKPAPWSAASP